MTTGELELEFQLMRRNNPDMNDEQLREAMFKRAMESVCDELMQESHQECGHVVVDAHDVTVFKRRIR